VGVKVGRGVPEAVGTVVEVMESGSGAGGYWRTVVASGACRRAEGISDIACAGEVDGLKRAEQSKEAPMPRQAILPPNSKITQVANKRPRFLIFVVLCIAEIIYQYYRVTIYDYGIRIIGCRLDPKGFF